MTKKLPARPNLEHLRSQAKSLFSEFTAGKQETQSPIAVDYLNVGKFSTGQITLGIMQWIGDEVQICMSAPGEPRPEDFSCEPGSGRTLSRWKQR